MVALPHFFCINFAPHYKCKIFGQAFRQMNKIRIDKWLWSVRIFKSRTLATEACKGGKVKVGSVSVKPSFQIAEGETVTVKKNGFNFQFKALTLIEKRVGAAIAVTCYEDVTPVEEKNKYAEWFQQANVAPEKRERGTGRPTKKERRDIEGLKDVDFYDWDDDV